jgi:TetR/AcrR family transcriptional regulator, mexJK operon transcriptional repressor
MLPRIGDSLSATKHAAIIAAATGAFLDRGYGASSMDDVAREAGVAKQTVYKHFGSKAALFRAIVDSLAGALLAPLSVGDSRDADPQSLLLDLAERFIMQVVDPVSVRLLRLLAAEAPRFPELAATVLQAGPERLIAELAAYLERHAKAGRLTVDCPRMAAEQFFGALRGNLQLTALLMPAAADSGVFSADQVAAYARSTVAAFLRGHAPRVVPVS